MVSYLQPLKVLQQAGGGLVKLEGKGEERECKGSEAVAMILKRIGGEEEKKFLNRKRKDDRKGRQDVDKRKYVKKKSTEIKRIWIEN